MTYSVLTVGLPDKLIKALQALIFQYDLSFTSSALENMRQIVPAERTTAIPERNLNTFVIFGKNQFHTSGSTIKKFVSRRGNAAQNR